MPWFMGANNSSEYRPISKTSEEVEEEALDLMDKVKAEAARKKLNDED